MTGPYKSVIVRLISCGMVPFMQLFGLYVITHGHYGPGGGFQGGVILGVSIIIQRLALGKQVSYKKFPPQLSPVLGGIGMLLYVLSGLIPVFMGGSFLDYSYLPITWVSGAPLRALGTFIVECGIGLSVFGTMVLAYDSLSGENW